MKKILLNLIFLVASLAAFGQGNVQNVIVEKIPATAAAIAADSRLTGATAYRIFIDMADGWEIQATYGDPVSLPINDPGNTLFIETTTSFYNATGGFATGRQMTNTQFGNAAGIFDSYLTFGSVTNSRVGILRTEDITDGTQDGYTTGTGLSLNFAPDAMLDDANDLFAGDISSNKRYSTTDGLVYLNGGQTGPAGTGNKVLIGQFTTTGDLSFEINVAIRNSLGVQEYYTARPGRLDEFVVAGLTYTSAVNAPSVNITTPSNGFAYNTGDVVTIIANATDIAPGVVDSVVFFRAGSTRLGKDASAAGGWTIDWTSVAGSHVLTAVAWDNNGNSTTSAQVTITVTTPSNPAPTVTLNAIPATIPLNVPYTFTATATDVAPGTVSSVVFHISTVPPTTLTGVAGSGNTYTAIWTPTVGGSVDVYARATDNGGASANSATRTTYVLDPSSAYLIGGLPPQLCTSSDVFCMPVISTAGVTNALGFDMVMQYDPAKVQPTGRIYVSENMIANEDWTSTSVSIPEGADSMFISLYLNSSAPEGTTFNNSGQLICVEFAKTLGFGAVDTAEFSMISMVESYVDQIQLKNVAPGSYISYKDENFYGKLLFWKDNSPMAYAPASNFAPTDVFGSTNCNDKVGTASRPNLDGEFVYNTTLGTRIKIERDILDTVSMQFNEAILGTDQLLVAKVLVNDASFKPNVFQMLAMDANRDGKITAGDLSQISLRAVKRLDEFQSSWNYNNNGTKKNAALSKDWLFVSSQTLLLNKHYRRSVNYPLSDADGGFTKNNVPVADTCHQIDIEAGNCPIVKGETYQSILVGDVDGSFAGFNEGNVLKSTEEATSSVIFDFANAIVNGSFVDVPVSVSSDEDVNALDFALKYDDQALAYNSIVKNASYIESADHYNTKDQTLRFTSYSLNNFELNRTLLSVRFKMNSEELNSSSVNSMVAYVNGKPASVKFTQISGSVNAVAVDIYPNPANTVFNVRVSEAATIMLMDMNGKSVLYEVSTNADQKEEINVSGLSDGMYLIKVYNDEFVTFRKVIVKR